MRKKESKKLVALLTVMIMLFTGVIPFAIFSNAAASVKIRVTLDSRKVTVNKGDTCTVSATITPDTVTDSSITWSSSDESIATVTTGGLITAVNKGKATITATSVADPMKSAKCNVTVKVPVSSVNLSTSKIETTLGAEPLKMTGLISPADANFKANKLTWSSSDENVAAVSKGVVTYTGVGTATISAEADNGISGTCTVTVSTLSVTDLLANVKISEPVDAPTSSGLAGKTLRVSIDQTKVELNKGDSTTLSAIFTPSDFTTKNVIWVSSNTDIASVTQEGVVTALAKGTAKIYAYSEYDGAKYGKCSLKVNVPITEIQLNTHTINTVVGVKPIQLKGRVYPSDAKKKLTWSSSNSSVATVSSGGKVEILGEGTSTITATASNGVTTACAVVVGGNNGGGSGGTLPPNSGAKLTTNLVVGDYVRIGAYDADKDGKRESDEEILWRVIHTENGESLLFSENILCLKPFDANGDFTDSRGDSNRMSYGSNYWEKSNLREWLNSSAASVSFSHLPPTNARVGSECNDYATEPGFLSNFTTDELSSIQSKSHKVLLAGADIAVKEGGTALLSYNSNIGSVVGNYDSAYYKNTTDSVRLLSVKEIREYLYNRSWDYQRKPTEKAVANSEYKSSLCTTENNFQYWTDTPSTSCPCHVRINHDIGGLITSSAYRGDVGVVPALTLKSGITLSGSGTQSAPYVPVF